VRSPAHRRHRPPLKLGTVEAEKAKHADGFIGLAAEPPSSEAWQRVHEVVIAELAPLARDLRQTLNTCRAKTGAQVGAVPWSAAAAGCAACPASSPSSSGSPPACWLPTTPPRWSGSSSPAACRSTPPRSPSGSAPTPSRASRLSTSARARSPTRSTSRSSAPRRWQLCAAALVVIGLGRHRRFAAHHKLRRPRKILTQRLAVESKELFPKDGPLTPSQVATKAVGGGAEASPLPKMSAYDILLDLNERLPGKTDVTIDIT
jgi:hypothetical protein